MAKQFLSKEVVAARDEKMLAAVQSLKEKGIEPCLAIVRVGERPDDISYERSAMKRMEKHGILVKNVVLDEAISQDELEEAFREVNEAQNVHGILLFQPLPKHLDVKPLENAIVPEKDVDGISPINAARLYQGDKRAVAPCTPSAVMAILDHYGVDLSGKRVTIVGRSLVVGRPLSMLMLHQNATVTIAHSRTKDLAARTSEADIVVAAIGRARMLTKDMVGEGAIAIDVGINVDENGKLCGDIDTEAVAQKAQAITPVPGGVGGVTTSILEEHVLRGAHALNNLEWEN